VDGPTIVIGLGNPGLRYRDTRHNVGFRVVDTLAARGGLDLSADGELGRQAWVAPDPESRFVLAKPRTYMNRSGRAAAMLCRTYHVTPENLLVIYDDADLALGRIRLRHEGGAGGHNGIRSIADVLGTSAFRRVRLGVRGLGRDDCELAEYVLEPFAEDEKPTVEALVQLGADAVEVILASGMELAMNRFNGRVAASETDALTDGPAGPSTEVTPESEEG